MPLPRPPPLPFPPPTPPTHLVNVEAGQCAGLAAGLLAAPLPLRWRGACCCNGCCRHSLWLLRRCCARHSAARTLRLLQHSDCDLVLALQAGRCMSRVGLWCLARRGAWQSANAQGHSASAHMPGLLLPPSPHSHAHQQAAQHLDAALSQLRARLHALQAACQPGPQLRIKLLLVLRLVRAAAAHARCTTCRCLLPCFRRRRCCCGCCGGGAGLPLVAGPQRAALLRLGRGRGLQGARLRSGGRGPGGGSVGLTCGLLVHQRGLHLWVIAPRVPNAPGSAAA